MHGGTCIECATNRYATNITLEFRDTNEQCGICMEQKGREMKFPTCSHWFCADCMRSIIRDKDPEEFRLDPVHFGCPPCPNGCTNPRRGRQCDCFEYCDLIDQWIENNSEGYQLWELSEEISQRQGSRMNWEGGRVLITHDSRGSRTCPFCRSETDY